jgi:aryl-alcohol dehydrogenase-like predicted oxidoreductase
MQHGVTCPIVGPRTLKQAEENFAVFDWELPAHLIVRTPPNKLLSCSHPFKPFFANRKN